MVEMYQCPSYYDDDGVLQDCECGKCDKPKIVRDYLAPGIRVDFGYYHNFNRRSRAWRVKTGTVIRTVKHRRGSFYNQPMVVVHFDGNKSNTTIEMSRISISKDQSGGKA